MELTPKQKAFADYYIECGKVTEAAVKAGYSKKTAAKIGSENLKKPDVSAYIAQRQSQIDSERICSIKEIQEFRSRIVRGEEKDQFDLDVATIDKLKAASDLEKALRIKEAEDERKKQEEAARNAKIYHLDLHNIPDNFHPTVRKIRNQEYTEFTFKGGRGGAKSSVIAMIIIEILKNNHDVHALVCRKVYGTIKDSVYAKIKWAIQKQGLDAEFNSTVSPYEITLKSTKQKIYFRGADDPTKIKSITPEFGYIGCLWLEELDQFDGPEEIRSIRQSALRGGKLGFMFESFNPPISKSNWANNYAAEPKENRIVHHSTYLSVPKDWLEKPFIEEAEHLKEAKPEAYKHEYLGIPIGLGTEIFKYLEIRTITDEEIKRQEKIYQGQDWGWEPDPKAFIRCSYSHATEKIMLIDEMGGPLIRVSEMAQKILDAGYDDYTIYCGADEKEHTNDFRDAGLPARMAIVGPGSVRRTFEWIQCRTIVIDPARTPKAYKEFVEYEHDVDKNGEVIDNYPDHDNHWIDALRYATSPLSMRRGNSA